jgi:sulfate adenylyltransferase subunit 2
MVAVAGRRRPVERRTTIAWRRGPVTVRRDRGDPGEVEDVTEPDRADPRSADLGVCEAGQADRIVEPIGRHRTTGSPMRESGSTMTDAQRYQLTQLQTLEAEAVFIFREVVAEFERPVLLFSGGKDSITMLRLAEKAFYPARIPFPVMHVDTGHNFQEVLDFRDRRVEELGVQLVVASVQEAIDNGTVSDPPDGTRNRIQTPVLLEALEKHRFAAIFGGARRDEDKARAKERIYSFRDDFGQWDPKNQRPELWSLYNGRIHPGESIRVFPLSNWTELDVWQYVEQERIGLPSIYYAHEREVFERNGMLFGVHESCQPKAGEEVTVQRVRYRTVGDASLTAAVRSDADTVQKVIAEVASTRITERGATRGDDKFSEAAMEDRKREGYF